MRQERKALEKLLTQPGVTHLGRLTREGTLREFAQAEVWAYPCTGGELCCKTALEAQATQCKVLVVPTTVLTETAEHGKHTTFARFADDLIETLRDTVAPTYPCPPSWDDLARWAWNVMTPGVSALNQVNIAPIEPPDTLPARFSIPACTSEPPTRQLSILLAVGGMPFDGETDRKRDLGGSETSALQLSRALAKRGHSVTVFSNLPEKPGKFDGVSYLPIDQYTRYAATTPHDVSIVQREPSAFNMALQSKLNILWCHDLGLKRYHVPFRSSLWNVDYVVPVSHWHGRQLCEVYDLPAELIVPMNNGIEYDLIRKTVDKKSQRDPNAIVYASRPERGLDVLLQSVFPRLLERNPKLVLYVAGYANTTQEMQGFYQHCQQLMDNFGDHAKNLGALTKAELYKLYSRAAAYVYVSRNFREVSCISLLESAACGLPVISTTLGALPETASRIDGATRLVEHPGREATPDFIDRFVNEAWDVLSNPTTLIAMSIAGATEAKSCSWDVIAEEWEHFLLGAIDLRSKDKLRLARHQWRLGDIRGVEHLLPELTPDEQVAFRHGAAIDTMDADTPPMPSQQIINALCSVADSLKPNTILGLGPHGTQIAQAVAQAMGAIQADDGPADLVIGVETLDCASDSSSHIADAQALAKPDGHICFVMASPGVQQDRLHNGQKRAKRWVFDNHDLKELFKDRADLLAMVIEGGQLSEYDGRPLAWQLYCFKNSTTKIGRIDPVRRLWLQSPQLSLTGAMIVKNGEGLLTRCLKSIVPYCDEIVVDDTGSTDTTPDILKRFGVEPGKGLNPLDVGFDAARNKGLDRATGDLILWVDADEELLDAKALPKYLRWSMYNGCAIQQHHFSAVPPNAFKPDLPVRLFRRIWLNGKNTGIRWIGRLHEHPESGMNQSVGQSIVLSDVHIAHDGYLTESKRRGRFDRNIALMLRDRAAYPERILGKFLMIRDWIHLARYDAEQNGGALTPSAVQYLEAAIESYRKDFLGGMHQMAIDGLQYYNEALKILQRGFEVQIALRVVGLDGQPRELTYIGHVLNEEDLQKILTNSARDLSAVWQGEYL
jgi:glycosyltransferase involved in cell wall biosynthesis